jgi:hypothetical protein
VDGECDLFKVIATLSSASRFASLLHGWQQECNEDGDDRNHDEQFDECEGVTSWCRHVRGLTEVISGKVRAVICSSRPDSPNCGLFIPRDRFAVLRQQIGCHAVKMRIFALRALCGWRKANPRGELLAARGNFARN